MTGTRARSARAPWPISRRPGPRMRPRLADGEGREVVVVHEALAVLRRERVEPLLLAHRAQGGDGEHLRLAAGEEAGAVGAGQHAHLAGDGADLRRFAAVRRASSLRMRVLTSRLISLIEGGQELFRLIGLRRSVSRSSCARARRSRPPRSLLSRAAMISPILSSAKRASLLPQLGGRLPTVRGFLGCPCSAMISSCRAMISWLVSCAKRMAPRIMSSGTSLAPASTIMTASWVPATTRSSWLFRAGRRWG